MINCSNFKFQVVLSTMQKGSVILRQSWAEGTPQLKADFSAIAKNLYRLLSSPETPRDVAQFSAMSIAFFFKSINVTADNFENPSPIVLALFGLAPVGSPVAASLQEPFRCVSAHALDYDHIRIAAYRALIAAFPEVCFSSVDGNGTTLAQGIFLQGSCSLLSFSFHNPVFPDLVSIVKTATMQELRFSCIQTLESLVQQFETSQSTLSHSLCRT